MALFPVIKQCLFLLHENSQLNFLELQRSCAKIVFNNNEIYLNCIKPQTFDTFHSEFPPIVELPPSHRISATYPNSLIFFSTEKTVIYSAISEQL